MKDKIKDKIHVSLYLVKELKEKLDKIAWRENRSISGQINHIIEAFFKEYNQKNYEK